MKKKISLFSFFAGIGILDLAFEKIGYNIVFVNEYNDLFMASYQYARTQMTHLVPLYGYHNDSAERYAKKRGKRKLIDLVAQEREKGNLVGFIGGPPCPDFSVAGKNAGVVGENGRLTKVYFDIICRCRPDFFLFENVKVISEKCSTTRRNIIGSIFSSKEMYEEISDKLYFEYASKGKPEGLKSCIARSAYNYFISELKNETLVSMSSAFDKALKNKGIAFFLAQKARTEGTSEYEIINDWIRLLATTPREDANTIKRMIRLSRVINSLEDTEELPDTDLQKLNTLEAFDYTINDYFLPVAAGDVFTNSRDEWFVLIGQDCDMARGINRAPKNALAELLPAKVRHQTQFDKWANDLRSASIYSFRKTLDSECEVLQVDYQSRQYIANEVLNLCSFNSDGQCRISLSEPLNLHQEQLIPNYMTTYYSKLQQFFDAVKTLRIQAEGAFETVIAEEYSPRLISFNDFDKTSETVSFDLRRVCRLTHEYVFYLYKLYLEYRGRKPFQTINLIRQEDTALPVLLNKQESGQYLAFRCVPIPNKNNRKNWCWIIDASELNRVLELLSLPILSKNDQEVILKDDSTELNLESGKKVRIVKMKQKVCFEYR